MNNTALEQLIKISEQFDINIQAAALEVLGNPKFPLWSGSAHSKVHHYGKGKLAQHTLEVVELCLQNNEYFLKLDKAVPKDQLFLAALFHDIGKLDDYDYYRKGEIIKTSEIKGPAGFITVGNDYEVWKSTEHKKKIYHISKSAIIWSKTFDTHLKGIVDKDFHDNVLHAILSHHGRLEWKSPVTPQDRMGWLLHLSDCMSARIDDCLNDFSK